MMSDSVADNNSNIIEQFINSAIRIQQKYICLYPDPNYVV